MLPAWPEIAAAAPETPVAFAPAPGVRVSFGHRTCGGWRRVFIWIVCPNPPSVSNAWSRSLAEHCWPPCRGSFRGSHRDLESQPRGGARGEPSFPLAGLRHSGGGEDWNGFILTPAIAASSFGPG